MCFSLYFSKSLVLSSPLSFFLFVLLPMLSLCSVFPPPLSSPLQVSRILYSFSTAFKRSSKSAPDVRDSALPMSPEGDVYSFTVSMEVREDDGKGNFRLAGDPLAETAAAAAGMVSLHKTTWVTFRMQILLKEQAKHSEGQVCAHGA